MTFHGYIPDGLIVRHTNDNPPDCNPRNLILGTHADNTRDKIERGRTNYRSPDECRGTNNGRNVLSDAQVLEIRARYAAGGTSYAKLGIEYKVSHNMIALIVKRKNWTHI